jgi:hypothetical protein
MTSAFNIATLLANTTTSVASSATNAALAYNHVGGATGQILYQVAPNVTNYIAVGPSGFVLASNGSSATFVSAATIPTTGLATTASNLNLGTAGQIPYQTAPGSTAFAGPGTAGQLIISGGTGGPVTVNTATFIVGYAANVAGTVSNATTSSYAAAYNEWMTLAISDEASAITTGTTKLTIRMPYPATFYQLPRASLSTATLSGSTATLVDIKINGTSMLTNKLIIDATTTTSVGSASPASFATTTAPDDAQLTIDLYTASLNARGLKVTLYYRRT